MIWDGDNSRCFTAVSRPFHSDSLFKSASIIARYLVGSACIGLVHLLCEAESRGVLQCHLNEHKIDRQAIIDEKTNIDQIVATLSLKAMTQGALIRKLCTYTVPNPTRQARSLNMTS